MIKSGSDTPESQEDSFDLYGYSDDEIEEEGENKESEAAENSSRVNKIVEENIERQDPLPTKSSSTHLVSEQGSSLRNPYTETSDGLPRSTTGGKSLINIFKLLKKSRESERDFKMETKREIIDRMDLCAKRIKEFIQSKSEIITFDVKPQASHTNRMVRRRLTDTVDDIDEYGDGGIDPQLMYQPRLVKNGVLADHQIEGLNWLINLYKCSANGLLADQMGLGKTIQTIAFLAYLREVEYLRKVHLIVCPLSVVHNWKNEFAKWFPDCKVGILSAVKHDRNETNRILESDVVYFHTRNTMC